MVAFVGIHIFVFCGTGCCKSVEQECLDEVCVRGADDITLNVFIPCLVGFHLDRRCKAGLYTLILAADVHADGGGLGRQSIELDGIFLFGFLLAD